MLQTVARRDSNAESEQLHRALGDFGDHELVLNGLHHNMLSRNFLDTKMGRTCDAFDHLHAADSLLTAIRHNMDFSLQTYLPATMLGIRAIVAAPDRYFSVCMYFCVTWLAHSLLQGRAAFG